MARVRGKEVSFKDLLLAFYSIKGDLPPDSINDLECSCGFQGVMEIFPHGRERTGNQFTFCFSCPGCQRRIPYLLQLPTGTRVKRLGMACKQRLFRILRLYSRPLIAGLLCLGFLAAAATRYPPLRGFKVLLEEGPTRALYWMKDPRTEREKFVQAWTLYTKGAYDEARNLNLALNKHNLDPKTRADSFYLSGLLEAKSGSGKAMEYFSMAVDLYSELGKYSSLQQLYLTIANFLVSNEDLDLAIQYLDLAESLPVETPNYGYFYETESEIHFAMGDYRQALESSRQGLEYYRGQDVDGLARMTSNIGFYLILTGELQQGLAYTIDAETLALEIGTMDLFYYNKINYLLLSKCSGFGEHIYVAMLEDRIEKTVDRQLSQYLQFAREWSCPPALKNKGDQGPPPPPDQQ